MEAQFDTGSGGWQVVARHIGLFALLMLIWEMANRLGADPLLFPRPTRIVAGMADIFFIDGNIWPHFYSTVLKAMLGMVIGTAIGMALGVAAALHGGFREYLKPYIVLIEATPRIAVGPIFVAALGFGISSAVALAALVCFFAPFVNTLTGLLSVDEEAEEMFRSLGASRLQIFFKLMVPNAMPLITAGLKLATASAFGGALVSEFIQANAGLGVLMDRYVSTLNMDYAFATLLSITAFGYLLFRAMEAADHRILYWHSEPLMMARSRRQAAAWRRVAGAS